MEELALRVRAFIYTMICFQCLLQLSVGNSFHKYLKLVSHLLALCICCNIFFSFIGKVEGGWEQADRVYEQWQRQWIDEEAITDMGGYLENQITKESINEFELQITDLLQKEGNGSYELREIMQHDGKWEIVIEGEQSLENNNFAEAFQESVCKEFSLEMEQLEVKLR